MSNIKSAGCKCMEHLRSIAGFGLLIVGFPVAVSFVFRVVRALVRSRRESKEDYDPQEDQGQSDADTDPLQSRRGLLQLRDDHDAILRVQIYHESPLSYLNHKIIAQVK